MRPGAVKDFGTVILEVMLLGGRTVSKTFQQSKGACRQTRLMALLIGLIIVTVVIVKNESSIIMKWLWVR